MIFWFYKCQPPTPRLKNEVGSFQDVESSNLPFESEPFSNIFEHRFKLVITQLIQYGTQFHTLVVKEQHEKEFERTSYKLCIVCFLKQGSQNCDLQTLRPGLTNCFCKQFCGLFHCITAMPICLHMVCGDFSATSS